MVAPLITDFGDEDHEEGETGLTVAGFDFFPGVAMQGTLWMFENADRSGASDALTIGTHTNNSIPDVEIPASPNNAAGAVFLAFQRGGDMAWSNSYSFTLSAAAVVAAAEEAEGIRVRRRPQLYYVEVDGEILLANSVAGVQLLLKRARELAEQSAEHDVEAIPDKKIRIDPPKVSVKTPSGKETKSKTIKKDVKHTEESIKRTYEKAKQRSEETLEISMLLHRKIEREEENAIVSLLI